MRKHFSKAEFKAAVESNIKTLYRKTIDEASTEQVFQAVSYAIKEVIIDEWIATHEEYEKQDVKVLYYMSMEFLIGRTLGNNVINIGAIKEVREALSELGFDLNAVEDREPDPALGNGGLGRLAACFLDSLATLGYPAYGCGIRYRYGMFKQRIENGYQVEVPDEWLKNPYPFEMKRPEYAYEVKFGGNVKVEQKEGKDVFVHENYNSVRAVPYDLPILGYKNNMVNSLRIWDAEAITNFSLEHFDRGEYQMAVEQENLARTIVEVLYPNDNHYAGKELRLKQQYFFISASIQRAIAKYKENHKDIKRLHEKVVFQMNDTHPTVAVPELMRILLDEEGLDWEEAWEVTTKTCAYTNHTIMSEALEKWPIDLFSRLLPRIYQIVEEINRRFINKIKAKYPGDEAKIAKMSILYNNQVRMAYMAIVGSFSVNGVARLHTEILKNQELKDFYQMMPEKFNNKTNGITQRRFLLHANPLLADWINARIGEDWICNLASISKLKNYLDDEKSAEEFMQIKYRNKVRLAKYIKEHNGIEVDPNSIFDIQVKRLHEYKRQLLNILHVMYLYNKLKDDEKFDMYPRTFIFGAKAAAGYRRAKDIIMLINTVADRINNDHRVNGKLSVVFIENYRVSVAEKIFPAADVSEQISTAGKEASGTGNMKFMINGAVTLGTWDGANIEIAEEAGIENEYIFGLKADEIHKIDMENSYTPIKYLQENPELEKAVNSFIDGTFTLPGEQTFRGLYDSLVNGVDGQRPDVYYVLADFTDYQKTHERLLSEYTDKYAWAKKCLLNIARSSKFSSDRTIEEYAKEIWKLKKIKTE